MVIAVRQPDPESSVRRTLLISLVAALGAAVLVPAAGARTPRRVGGDVALAWPLTKQGAAGRTPKRPLARWLARQVGPQALRPLAPRTRAGDVAADRTLARKAAATSGDPSAADEPPTLVKDRRTQRLSLVRSYDIPRDDPAYARLENLSFTYDSAVAALAFLAAGDRAQAAMLLDQLAALQRTDGSIDLAFDTRTGESARVFRTGTAAWVGLAALRFQQATGSTRYTELIDRSVRWIRQQTVADGLVKGGPDVSWVSTQNNLIAALLLRRHSDSASRSQALRIFPAILLKMVKGDRVLQGLNDPTQPTDVQALAGFVFAGEMREQATRIVRQAIAAARVDDVSIVRSSDPATYNMSFAAPGPFVGFRPYLDADGPRLIWFEWTVQMRIAMDRLGIADPALDASMARWAALAGGAGPLGASATRTDARFNEFHVWPSAAAGSWLLLQRTKPDVLLAG
jgi:hypothetical protein